jgi:hypothetical protein
VSAAARRSSRARAPFFEWLDGEPFALRADVEVSGSVYRACGTSVETRVLVIDRVETSETCVTGRAESVQELVELLAPVRALRVSAEVPEQSEPVGERLPVPSGDGVAGDVASLALVGPSGASSWPPEGVEPLEVMTAEEERAEDELTACIFDAYVPHVEVPGAKAAPDEARRVGGDGRRGDAALPVPPEPPAPSRGGGTPLGRPARNGLLRRAGSRGATSERRRGRGATPGLLSRGRNRGGNLLTLDNGAYRESNPQ